jgi:hypothetical protein
MASTGQLSVFDEEFGNRFIISRKRNLTQDMYKVVQSKLLMLNHQYRKNKDTSILEKDFNDTFNYVVKNISI